MLAAEEAGYPSRSREGNSFGWEVRGRLSLALSSSSGLFEWRRFWLGEESGYSSRPRGETSVAWSKGERGYPALRAPGGETIAWPGHARGSPRNPSSPFQVAGGGYPSRSPLAVAQRLGVGKCSLTHIHQEIARRIFTWFHCVGFHEANYLQTILGIADLRILYRAW